MLSFFKNRQHERGDTLIEVLFAVTVFSFIVVSSITLMNQGLAASQRSLEITLVRQQMDNQAEVLRFMHDSYVEAYQSGIPITAAGPALEYSRIIQFAQNAGLTSASPFGANDCVIPPNAGRAFIVDTRAATLVTTATNPTVFAEAPSFAQLTYTAGNVVNQSQGMWIEAVRSNTTIPSAGYIDFHIRACWDATGTSQPMNLGTIVRLYEPRG